LFEGKFQFSLVIPYPGADTAYDIDDVILKLSGGNAPGPEVMETEVLARLAGDADNAAAIVNKATRAQG
jgi:hypothetical protein